MEGLWHWQTQGGPLALFLLSVLFALVFIIVVLWLTLPFALFGTKRLLREILQAQRETNQRLEELREGLRRPSREVPSEPSPSDWQP